MEEDDYIELSSFSMYIAAAVRECAVKMSKAIDNYQYLLRANYKYWQNNTIQSTHSYQTSAY